MSPNKNSPSCVGYEPAYIQRPRVPYMRPGRPTVRYLTTYELTKMHGLHHLHARRCTCTFSNHS